MSHPTANYQQLPSTMQPRSSSPLSEIIISAEKSMGSIKQGKIGRQPVRPESIEVITIDDSDEEDRNENIIETHAEHDCPVETSFAINHNIQPIANEDMQRYFSQIAAAFVAKKMAFLESFTCTFCSISFTNFAESIAHFQGKHNNKMQLNCRICGTQVNCCSSLQDHLETSHGMSWEIYTLNFPSWKNELRQCQKCNKAYDSANSYKNHNAYYHGDNQQMTCGIKSCKNKTRFKNKWSLRKHVIAIHHIKWSDYMKSENFKV